MAEWTPDVVTEGQFVTVKQGVGLHMLGAWHELCNDWKLALGTAKPFELTVTKGAGESQLSLGGVPLASARIEVGAGKSTHVFDKANPTECSTVKVDLGAGSLRAEGLLNANTERFAFGGGQDERGQRQARHTKQQTPIFGVGENVHVSRLPDSQSHVRS